MSGKILTEGHDNSMGLVRYYLALAVLIAHFNTLTGSCVWFPTSSYNAVGGFFALSGFLIYRSYLRHRNLKTYLIGRGRRILPPYVFIVLLCAFGLVAVSTLPAKEYFFNPQWLRYLICNLTFLNFLCPELPGVFQNLPLHAVNGSLWTMKVEVVLYLSVPIVAAVVFWLGRRVKWCGSVAVCVLIYVLSSAYRFYCLHLFDVTGNEIFDILARQVFGQFMYFYGGVGVYFVYDSFMRYRHMIFGISIMLILFSDFIPYKVWVVCISPVVVVCLVIYFSHFRFGRIFNKNNISYDIYLYHMPVMLVIYTYVYGEGLPLWAVFSMILGCTLVLGYVSWFFIGKKFLRR